MSSSDSTPPVSATIACDEQQLVEPRGVTVAAIALALIGGVMTAWILLIEILR